MSEVPTDILLPKPTTQYQRDLNFVLSDFMRKIADAVNENIFLPSDGAYYLGDLDTDGSWRIIRSGNNLLSQRLESGTWTTKQTITP